MVSVQARQKAKKIASRFIHTTYKKYAPATIANLKKATMGVAEKYGIPPQLTNHALNVGQQLFQGLFKGQVPSSKAPTTGKAPMSLPMVGSVTNVQPGLTTQTSYVCRSKKFASPTEYASRFKTTNYSTYMMQSQVAQQGIGAVSSGYSYNGSFVNDPANLAYFTGDIAPLAGVVAAVVPIVYGNLSTAVLTAKQFAITNASYRSVSPDQKVFIDKGYCKSTFANQSEYNISMDIYELICKKSWNSIQFSENTGSNECYTFPYGQLASTPEVNLVNLLNPGAHWNDYYDVATNVTDAGSAATTFTSLNAKPTDSVWFNSMWRIAARHTLNMAAGTTHIHNSVYEVRKVLSYGDINSSLCHAGLTRTIMCVIRGSTVKDRDNDSLISIGPAKVAAVHEFTMTGSLIRESTRVYRNTTADLDTITNAETTTVNNPGQDSTLIP